MKAYNFFIMSTVAICLCACKSSDDSWLTGIAPEPSQLAGATVTRGYSIPIELTQAQKDISNKLHAFSWKLFGQMYSSRKELVGENGHENVLLSPYSVEVNLGMLANGLTGKGYSDLLKGLGLDGYGIDELNDFFDTMNKGIAQADDIAVFKSANSFWYKSSLTVSEAFEQKLTSIYESKVAPVDFTSPDAVRQINSWVSDATNANIERIVDMTFPFQDFHLLNAVCFNGGWFVPFSKSETEKADFYNADGTTQKVDMMHNYITTFYNQQNNYAVARLGIDNGAYEFFVIQPNEGNSIESIAALITPDVLKSNNIAHLDLWLPKFQLGYYTDKMGFDLAQDGTFVIDKSDTELFVDHETDINTIMQKSFISIDEDGIEVSAATDVNRSGAYMAPNNAKMRLDHPFIYGIVETSTNMPLFIGYYGN